jgi:hypothetical protein
VYRRLVLAHKVELELEVGEVIGRVFCSSRDRRYIGIVRGGELEKREMERRWD